MNIKITVTKDDIRLGRPKMADGTRCPVARAMKRAKIPFCIVSNKVWLDKLAWTHKLPRKVVKFITDCCHPERTVKPFSFYLRTK